MSMALKVGDKAPEFNLKDSFEKDVSLKDFKGKRIILYFYPKDNTPGCTKEACNFKENWDLLQKNNIVVLGISKDNALSHKKFIEKFNLPFNLLAILKILTWIITEIDSTASIPPIIKRDQRLFDINAIPPREAPIAKEPESPINNFAGYLFKKRNPIHFPAITIQRGANVKSLFGFSIKIVIARPVKINTLHPLNKPSKPSVKLVELLSANNTNIPKG